MIFSTNWKEDCLVIMFCVFIFFVHIITTTVDFVTEKIRGER